MEKILQDFGLSEKEAAVYFASLTLGKATADQLSKQSKINRSTTYVQIESLSKKGLMSQLQEGKKTYFAPERPENLSRVLAQKKLDIESKEVELAKYLPDLSRMFDSAGERPIVRFYEGKEGIIAVREEALACKEKIFKVIYSYTKFREIFSDEELKAYSRLRSQKGIRSQIIYPKIEEPNPNYKPQPLTEVKFVGSLNIPFSTDILIYDDVVVFIVLSKIPHAMLMKSGEIAKTMNAVFDYFWITSPEVPIKG